MPPTRKLTCLQCLERLQHRIEKHIAALERVRLPGNETVVAELRVELDYQRRAKRYLEDGVVTPAQPTKRLDYRLS